MKTTTVRVTVTSPAFASTLRRELPGPIEANVTVDMPDARKLVELLEYEGLDEDADWVRNIADRRLITWNKTRYGKTVQWEGRRHQITIDVSKTKNLAGKYVTRFMIAGVMDKAPIPMNFIRGEVDIESATKASQQKTVRRIWDDWETYAKQATTKEVKYVR